MKILDIIKSPDLTAKVFNKVMQEIDRLNVDKDAYSMDILHHNYSVINKRFMKFRDVLRFFINENDELYTLHREACSKSFLYFIMLEGWSYDINKSLDNEPLMAFIPYSPQLPLIDGLQRDEKNIHVQKARRQGASKIFILFICWLLIFGKNEVMYATHKDLESLDMIEGDEGHNSTFDNVRWILDQSLFVDKDWQDGADKGNTKEKQINLNGNVLKGAVLGKGTAVGMAGTRIFVDEIDVVCDLFPNQAGQIVGSFSQAINHIYLYSTYRSMDYPFYQFRVDRPKGWFFYDLDWRENPTCNREWYDIQRAKLGNCPVLTARELDRDPTKTRAGGVFSRGYNAQRNDYDQLDKRELIKVIGADFGGGTSYTSFVLGYLNVKTGVLYIDDIVESTGFDHIIVKEELKRRGFENAKIFADTSIKAQSGAAGYDWLTLLRSVGLNPTPVNNQGIYYTHSLMNMALENRLIMINKRNNKVVSRFTGYRYKDDKVFKDDNSHFGDACSYLYKGIFHKVERGVIELK